MYTGSMKKLRVGLIFGGESAEHEVSVMSARNVRVALDEAKYEPVLIKIDRSGVWHLVGDFDDAGQELAALPGRGALLVRETSEELALDAAFPILHGPMGEDGTVQGLLELAKIPYVGPGVLGSAVGMDKDIMKRLLRDAGLGVADCVTVTSGNVDADEIIEQLGLPLFVKPANMGSSVGVSKVDTAETLKPAVLEALRYDTKVLVESAIVGDEIECAVLGNANPQASTIGRVVPQSASFYSYDAKYVDSDGALLEIPAKLPEDVMEQARQTALLAYQVLGCEGMTRVDMFAQKDGSLVINEINTIPGFTNISMYPKLWEASGLGYTDLITRLLELALERHATRAALQTQA